MILAGDAAHPILPFAAQGACAALEDAGALHCLFQDIKDEGQLRHRIHLFDGLRRMRASRIQTISMVPAGSQLNPDIQAQLEPFATDDDLDGKNFGDLMQDAVKYAPDLMIFGQQETFLTWILATTYSSTVRNSFAGEGK
jgi:2-polyprenyl-6-methoxyphenol hydroxylase-like FAD-dependent oxidoreductase